MKVYRNPYSTTPTSKERAKRQEPLKSGREEDFIKAVVANDGHSPTASALNGITPAFTTDFLLAVQEVRDENSSNNSAKDRGNRMLQQLQELQVMLLESTLRNNHITAGKLDDIVRTIDKARQTSNDPALDNLINDIELRVSVELAKLGINRRME